ncbi:uncharacterized protein LOC143602453 [Bidens hawaiensis]|uniref:uncharacterized protein LOC143602453 n=1 Tax=Bidens hawaiensis TaxID=980011 RepID=UPI00404B8E8A
MDTKTLSENLPPSLAIDYSANVDTSSAFRSVKEAVEIFGERFLTGEIFLPSPKPPFTLPKQETPSWKSTHTSQRSPPPPLLVNSLKKLESELEETKKELKLLKERESETEAVLASLNAELHKDRLKIIKADEKAPAAGWADPVVKSGGGGRKVVKKKKKKKPIVPLLGDLFSKRKEKSNASYLLNPLYTSPQKNWI